MTLGGVLCTGDSRTPLPWAAVKGRGFCTPEVYVMSMSPVLSFSNSERKTVNKLLIGCWGDGGFRLLLLFKFWHICKTENPAVDAKQDGTEAVVTTNCSNPKCPKQVNMWYSQPFMPNSQIPAGNFLVCMAVLLATSSATKVFQVFKHMGLSCVSLNTYF